MYISAKSIQENKELVAVSFIVGGGVVALAEAIRLYISNKKAEQYDDNIGYEYTEYEEEKENDKRDGHYLINNEKPELSKLFNTERVQYSTSDTIFSKKKIPITSREYMKDDGYVQLVCTYFVNDGVLAGYDDHLDEIDIDAFGEDSFIKIFENNPEIEAAYFKDEDGYKYEIIASKESYLESLRELETVDQYKNIVDDMEYGGRDYKE